ncbi:hypothetical protein [Rhizobium sp.]|jgi:hypothetical protein|uniref:hypothetical protein n=1 Tax=Rhizobium sp. TaxID=391 RepID=UPI002896B4FD
MLKVTALATALSLAVSSSVLGAETRIERADPSVICLDEDMTLSVWRSQSTVLSFDYTRTTASLVVDGRRWLQLPQNIQTSIALSAFCRPAMADTLVVLEVRNQSGNLLGTVSRGKWHNRLTGQWF